MVEIDDERVVHLRQHERYGLLVYLYALEGTDKEAAAALHMRAGEEEAALL